MVKSKAFFIIFKRFSVAKNCLRPDSAPLINNAKLGPADYFRFHHTQFWHQVFIHKRLERSVFLLEKHRKIKSFNITRATWATKAILGHKTKNKKDTEIV